MKNTFVITFLFSVIIIGCNSTADEKTDINNSNNDCDSLKTITLSYLEKNNLDTTIITYKKTKDCHKDNQFFLNNLALLYLANQDSINSTQTFKRVIDLINSSSSLDQTEKSLKIAHIYILLNDPKSIENELNKIKNVSLNEKQKEELDFYELTVKNNEYITNAYKVELQLFE